MICASCGATWFSTEYAPSDRFICGYCDGSPVVDLRGLTNEELREAFTELPEGAVLILGERSHGVFGPAETVPPAT